MARKILITTATIAFLGAVFIINPYYFNSLAQTNQPTVNKETIEKATTEYLAKICSGHGGVNCSIINETASVVCNDKTIDESLVVFAVPECYKTLDNIADQQSYFMMKSGCFPPSEMGCFSGQSYQNLYKILAASKLANSELGKAELSECRQQIEDYSKRNANYKQCLIEHNNTQLNLLGDRLMLPILKTVFCSIFYGEKASYDKNADLCLCDKGYFMSNNQCLEATQICQSKYGYEVYAQNGNCVTKSVTPTPAFPQIKQSAIATPRPKIDITIPIPQHQIIGSLSPNVISQYLIKNDGEKSDIKESLIITTNPFSRIFNIIILGLKNILKLF